MFDKQFNIKLQKGYPEAFKELFCLLYPRLKGYCSLFVNDKGQVEDIIQDSFINLWEKRGAINTAKSVESYLFVSVRNRCLNHLKKAKFKNDFIELDQLKPNELQYLYQLDLTNRIEKSIEEMLVMSFQSAVNELPDKMRLVFSKCKIEGRKQKDVAEELNISVKMVEKHISKAKQFIRGKLIEQYPMMIVLISLMLD